MMTAPSPAPPETASVLRDKRLLLYWFARVSTTLGNQMLAVAVGWQIYALTGSPFYLGLVGLAQFLPLFLLSLLVGHVADRWDRRLIICVCQFVEGAGALVLAAGSYSGWLGKEAILVIVFVLGAARAFEMPTMMAFLPGLVSVKIFPRAVALASSSTQTASIIGPALGGLLYAAGPTVVYTTLAALFVGAGLFMTLIRITRIKVKSEPLRLQPLFAGIAFIRSRPAIYGAISLDLFAVLLGGATALLPVYAREILVIGPLGLGFLRSAPAFGALLMSIVLARRPLQHRIGRTMFAAVIIFGLATIAFALSRCFLLSIGTLVVLGGADVFSVVIRHSLVQMETPDAMRGRVSAVNSMFIGTSNQLGEFESGLTAAWFGVVPAVLIGGIGTIVVAVIWMRLFPELVNVDTLSRD